MSTHSEVLLMILPGASCGLCPPGGEMRSMLISCCADCSFEFTGEGSDDIMHEAVCHHLGLLTPREIRGVRGNIVKSRHFYARQTQEPSSTESHLTGIDEESIRKLERGFMLPNIVKDNFLYLLSLSENFEAVFEGTCLKQNSPI